MIVSLYKDIFMVNYQAIELQAKAYLEGSTDMIANAANLSSIIFNNLENINWAGFYFKKGEELVLGPFQGRAACVSITMGRGVCGTAAKERRTVIAPDVHTFEGHIACDSASRSEIVIPIIHEDRLVGVLDVDSPIEGRFDDEDRTSLEKLVEMFISSTDLAICS